METGSVLHQKAGRIRTSEENVEVERGTMTDSNTQVNLLEQHPLTT